MKKNILAFESVDAHAQVMLNHASWKWSFFYA